MATLNIIKLSDQKAPIFLADTDGRETFDYQPDRPLIWRYRVRDGSTAGEWREIPHDALVEVEENGRMVRLVGPRLAPEGQTLELQVMSTGDNPMTSKPFRYAPTRLAEAKPIRPFNIDDDGPTNSGDPPRS